jgi:hypothetical protein
MEKFEEIMEPIFESVKGTPPHSNYGDEGFGFWLSDIQYKLMPSDAHGLLKKTDIDKIIAAYEAQGGLTYDQLIALFPDSRLQEERQRERQREERQREERREERPREPVTFYDKQVTFSDKNPTFIDVFGFPEAYKLYKTFAKQGPEEFLELIKKEFKVLLTENPNIDTSFIPDHEFTSFANAIGLDTREIENIIQNRPIQSAVVGKKGGKTKRRKNKKTKRRKNKKTKRRK